MKLEVHERIALMGLLPKEGNYAALTSIRRAREAISFSPDEVAFYKLRVEDGPGGQKQTAWDPQKATEAVKDVPIEEYIMSEIRNKLAELNKKGKLTEELYSLYEKFVVLYS